MDMEEFRSEAFQRVFQYLSRVKKGQSVDDISILKSEKVNVTEKNNEQVVEMLECLLTQCCIDDPSWAELRHFVWFLNCQLLDTEKSVFCSQMLSKDLPGFRLFVVNFMIQMSKVSVQLSK